MHANNAGESPDLSLHAVCAEAPVVPDGEGGATVRAVVIPAPGAGGVVPTRGGAVHRLPRPAQLAAALNAQEVDARIDFDHESEPASKTFSGSTAARGGWLSDFRAEADGAISAALALSAEAAEKLRRKLYRYLSPGLYLKRGGEIVAISSLALVNNPNMRLDAPTLSADGEGDADARDAALREREAAIEQREAAAEQRALNAATAAVDTAVEQGRLAPAQKGFALGAIKTHADGIEGGIAAFEAAYAAPAMGGLDKRTGPRGAPPSDGAGRGARFEAPPGFDVAEEDVKLHAQVSAHARKRGISYRDAVVELGALT